MIAQQVVMMAAAHTAAAIFLSLAITIAMQVAMMAHALSRAAPTHSPVILIPMRFV
jgi:hypothetical protein